MIQNPYSLKPGFCSGFLHWSLADISLSNQQLISIRAWTCWQFSWWSTQLSGTCIKASGAPPKQGMERRCTGCWSTYSEPAEDCIVVTLSICTCQIYIHAHAYTYKEIVHACTSTTDPLGQVTFMLSGHNSHSLVRSSLQQKESTAATAKDRVPLCLAHFQ